MEVGITILQNCYEFDVLVMATLLRTLGKKNNLNIKIHPDVQQHESQ